jgi:hypothetical protein
MGNVPVGQVGAGDPVGEPGVVLDFAADPGLAAEGAGIHDNSVDAFPGGVDSGRQPGRSAADDNQVVGASIRREGKADAACQRFVARVHLMSPVRVDHRWDDLPAALQLLEPPESFGVLINVDTGVADPVGSEELLHSLAVRAPRGPVHGEDRLVWGGHRPGSSNAHGDFPNGLFQLAEGKRGLGHSSPPYLPFAGRSRPCLLRPAKRRGGLFMKSPLQLAAHSRSDH